MYRVATKTERGSQERKSILMTRRKTYQRGSVKLHNGSWTLRYRELEQTTGKWQTRRVVLGKFKDKKDALKASEPIMARINERNNSEPQKLYADLTFKEFIETRWKAYTVTEKHQISTLDMRNSFIQIHLLPFFGKMKMREVQPTHISDFLDSKQGKYSGSTMRALYSVIHLLFEIAEQFDLVDKSPVRPKRHRPKLIKVQKPTLSAKQIQEVLSNLPDEQDRLFVLLLSVTGMRVREAMALRWMDFNAQGCELAICHTLYKGKLKIPKTEASADSMKLHPSMAALLVTHREMSSFQSGKDFIFCRLDGQPLDYMASLRRLRKSMKDCKITRERGKHGFHIFRHSAGTLLYEKSRDLKLVQGTLRHSDISTTSDIYVHLGDKVLREGTQILMDEILANCDLFVTQKSKKAG